MFKRNPNASVEGLPKVMGGPGPSARKKPTKEEVEALDAEITALKIKYGVSLPKGSTRKRN